MLGRCCIVVGLATVLLMAPALGQAPATPKLLDVVVGDRWVYETKDAITGEVRDTITVTVIEVSDQEINTRHIRKPNERPRQIVYDRTWSRLDDDVWKFTPSDQLRLTPDIAVGQTWPIRNTARHMRAGTVLNAVGTARVIAAEKVTTKAGTFDTLQIEVVSDQSQGADASRTSRAKLDYWFAPEAGRWVRKITEIRRDGRIRDKFMEDLVSFERKR